jgi:hypothetical protein
MFDGNYPFLDVLWTAILIFAWMIWLWMAISIFADIIRRSDASGFKKVLWSIVIVFAPFIGVLAYLLTNGEAMARRTAESQRRLQTDFDEHVRTVAGGADPAAQIANAKQLLDTGAITSDEYAVIKRKALG